MGADEYFSAMSKRRYRQDMAERAFFIDMVFAYAGLSAAVCALIVLATRACQASALIVLATRDERACVRD